MNHNCKDIEPLLSGYLDGELPQGDRARVELILQNCKCCSDALNEMKDLGQQLADLSFEELTATEKSRLNSATTSRGKFSVDHVQVVLGLRKQINGKVKAWSEENRSIGRKLFAWLHRLLSPRASPVRFALLLLFGLCALGAVVVEIIRIQSPNQNVPDGFGQVIQGFVDVTGDGIDELFITAPEPLPNLTEEAGSVYLYDVEEQAIVYRLTGPAQNTHFGWGVELLGDLTGDGIPEVACSAARGSQVFLFDGKTGESHASLESPKLLPNDIPRNIALTHFGHSVCRVPDVNGDGIDEIAVGQPEYNHGPGRVFVFDGATLMVRYELVSPNAQRNGRFFRTTGLSDIDGDGYGDLLVAATMEDVESGQQQFPRAGRAYLFSGASGELVHTFISPNLQVRDDGKPLGNAFGYSMEQIGDLDLDGFKDIAICANEPLGPSPDERARDDRPGRIYIYSSVSGSLLQALESPDPSDTGFGFKIQTLPDLTGD